MRILAGMGMRPVLERLQPLLQAAAGENVDCHFEIAGRIHARILAREPADVVVLQDTLIAYLHGRRLLLADSIAPLAQPQLAAFVQAGAPRPDVGTVAAFCAALIEAPTIAITDPASGGISGTAVQRILADLHLDALLAPKLRLGRPGWQPTQQVATGEAALGIVQLSEVLAAPGVELAGLLPGALQPDTHFCAAVPAQAKSAHAARDCIAALRSPAGESAMRALGLLPLAPTPRS